MDNVDKIKLKEAIKTLRKRYGKDAIGIIGKSNIKAEVERLKTNFEDFDNMLEGGLPKSRIIEIFGPEGAGKTSVCLAIAASVDMAVFIDAEGTLDENRAKELGVIEDKMMLERPESGEEICDVIVQFVKANVPLIIIDSVPAIVPHDFLEKVEKTAFVANNIAGTARLLSQKLFPTLIPALKDSQSIVIFINQIREKVGMVFGNPEITPGGRALKHYSALRIQIRRKAWYGKVDKRIGQLCSFRTVKSKVSIPYKEAEMPLHFKKGFVTHDEIKKLMKENK